jgi:hypothetical protein
MCNFLRSPFISRLLRPSILLIPLMLKFFIYFLPLEWGIKFYIHIWQKIQLWAYFSIFNPLDSYKVTQDTKSELKGSSKHFCNFSSD